MYAAITEKIVGEKFSEAKDHKKMIDKGGKMIAEFPSAKDPKRIYHVIKTAEGYLHCCCPAWLFQKQPVAERTCKHVKEVLKLIPSPMFGVKVFRFNTPANSAPEQTEEEIRREVLGFQESTSPIMKKTPWTRRGK